LRELAAREGLPFFGISSVTGQGIDDLKRAMAQEILKPAEEKIKQPN
jgi:selenocysteine-specific translation elongation factor